MRRLNPIEFPSWSLPLVALGLSAPVIAGFALGGPPLGLFAGAVVAAIVVLFAARARFDEPIEVASTDDRRFRVLVLAIAAVDEGAAEAIRGAVEAAPQRVAGDPEVLVVAPALNRPLSHWASDLREARLHAQERLAVSLATLTTAGIDATGRVGDTDPMQAAEDALRSFAAAELIVVDRAGANGSVGKLRHRLDRPVRDVRI